MSHCLLAVGSNQGDRLETIRLAYQAIAQLPGTSLVSHSTLHETSPVGGPPGQGAFLNGAAILQTTLPPEELLTHLQRIEAELGRVRGEVWGPRPIDLDLLIYDDRVLDTPQLTLPHPRMSFRPFVLGPAVEIAADWKHPLLDCQLHSLWERLTTGDSSLFIYGGSPPNRDWLAGMIAQEFRGVVPENAAESPMVGLEHFQELAGEGCWLRLGSDPLPVAPTPRLSIFFKAAGQRPLPGLPTLTLANGPPEHLLGEAYAAVELVWPKLSRATRSELK